MEVVILVLMEKRYTTLCVCIFINPIKERFLTLYESSTNTRPRLLSNLSV